MEESLIIPTSANKIIDRKKITGFTCPCLTAWLLCSVRSAIANFQAEDLLMLNGKVKILIGLLVIQGVFAGDIRDILFSSETKIDGKSYDKKGSPCKIVI